MIWLILSLVISAHAEDRKEIQRDQSTISSKATASQNIRLDNLDTQIKQMRGGRPIFTSIPTFLTHNVSGSGFTLEGSGASDGNVNLFFKHTVANSRNWLLSANYDALGGFAFKQSNTTGGDAYSGANRLAIDGSGRIGIGIISPEERLHVNGLIKSSGTVGITDGSIAALTEIGYIIDINGTGITPAASAAWVAIATITVPAGDWDMTGTCWLDTGGTTAGTQIQCALSQSNTTYTQATASDYAVLGYPLVANQAYTLFMGPRNVNASGNQTWYLIGNIVYTTLGGATWSSNSYFKARRVR